MAYCHGSKTKSKTSARALRGARASVSKEGASQALQRCTTAAIIGRWPLHAARLRLRRASFFFRGSSKYGGSAAAEPHLLCHFPIHILLSLSHRAFRSSPLEKLSPKSFSNDHIDSPPGEHYLRPVMDIVDVRFYPSILSSSLSAWCHPNTGTSLPLPCSTLACKPRLGSLRAST
jgi:hypothetical protein